MAEDDLLDLSDPFASEEFQSVTAPKADPYSPDPYASGSDWTDYPKAVASRAAGIGADLSSVLRAIGESDEDQDSKAAKASTALGIFGQSLFSKLERGANDSMSATAQRDLQATITDPNFWSLNAIGLKMVNTAPDIVAAVIPAVVTKNVLTSAAVGGTLSAAAMVDELYAQTDAMSDAELQAEAPFYKEMRDEGLDEGKARARYNTLLRSYRPLIAGTIGAITNAWTPGGQLAGKIVTAIPEEIGEGVAKRVGKGIAEGAVSEGIQEGTEEGLTQSGLQAGGLQDSINVPAIIEHALGGAVIGGILGGGVSAVPNRSSTPVVQLPTSNADIDLTTTPAAQEDIPPPTGGTTVVAKPADAADAALPGVTIPDPAVNPDQPTTAQEMQARKRYKTDYMALTDKQKDIVDAALTRRGLPVNAIPRTAAIPGVVDTPVPATTVQTVPVGVPDAAQTVAIATAKPIAMPVAQPDVATLPVTTQVTPDPTLTETVTPAPVPIKETRVETPVQPEVAPVVTLTPEARPAPAVAEPTPIPVEPVPVMEAPQPRGPRILVDKDEEARINAEAEKTLARNIKEMNKPDEPVGAKLSKAQVAQRDDTRTKSLEIAEQFKPTPEENNIYSRKPAEKTTAMRAIKARADAIAAAVREAKVTLPKKFKDTTDAGQRYNPETLLMMEAERLARIERPKLADFERFVKREYDLRAGALDEVLADRRAEGEAANRRGTGVDEERTADETEEAVDMSDEVSEDDIADAEAADARTPEEELIEKQEEIDRREEVARKIAAKSREVPVSVEEALDDALGTYTVPKADRKAAVVETRKKRTFTKPTQKQIDAAAKPIDDAASRKRRMDEVFAKKREAEEAVKKTIADLEAKAKARKEAKVTTEVTPKVAEIKKRVEVARAKTNPDPTPAQKEVGNYAKGRVSIQGLPVAIENPKGSARTGTNPDGTKWSVKMKNDYGYIVGTKGVDGDAIDAYIGPDPDSANVFVIDQLDFPGGAFDEHKVMLGFKDEQAAIRAYDNAFSDGMGIMRVGAIKRMTVDEFKAWIAKPGRDRWAASVDNVEQNRSLLIEISLEQSILQENAYTGQTPAGYIIDPVTKRVAKPLGTSTAQEAMWGLDFSHLRGASRPIAGTMRNKLTQLVGDIKVHVLPPDDVKRLTGRPQDSLAAYGYHVYKPGGDEFIVLNAEIVNDKAKLAHTLIHEVVHAATVKSINTNPAVNNIIKSLAYETIARLETMSQADRDATAYGLTNTKEFIAEAMSNPQFQDVLSRMELTPQQAASLKLDQPVRNMWDAFISAVRRALGLPKGTFTMLEAAIRATEFAMASREDAVAQQSDLRSYLDGNTKTLRQQATEALGSITTRPDLAPTRGNPHLMGLRTLDSIARAADRYFPNNNPVRRIVDIIEGQRVAAIKEFDRAAPVIQKLHDLERKYKGSQWDDFTSLVHDETMAGVYADRPLSDQKHISKDGARDSWQRQQHPGLAQRYRALPDDLKEARKEAIEFFKNKQNEMALKLIRNRIVTLFDTPDPDGLAQRILDKSVTDDDKKLMGEAYDAIAAAGVLAKVDGPYVPLMRRGNYVVKGRTKVTTPGNATAISDNEFEFKDKKDAEAFMSKQAGRPTLRTIYVDKTTGLATGTENGSTVRLTANDMNAEPRYRVVVQDRHVEMFDTMKEARARVAELRAIGMDVDDAVPRSFENYGIQADALSTQMRRMNGILERRADERKYTFEQKQDLLRTLNEMSLAMLGSTRIQSRALRRRYVAGASKDFVRNTTDYAHSAGNYIAKLDWRPKLDAALGDLDDAVKESQQDGLSAGRTAIQNEILRRATTTNPAVENKTWNAVTSRVLSMSFIDKLMSPSYSVINAAQPMMITTPYLAAHYGAIRAYGAMLKAYNDIGSLSALREGFAATVKKSVPGNIIPTDPVSLIRSRLKDKGEQGLIDILVERGIIDTDSGLEVSQLVKDQKGVVGQLDRGLGYLEGISRQMPKTIEAMNRTVSALAAYRLEMERSGDKARAVQFAQDTINLTQFNYSASNTAPIMNHPALRLALQFKKYGLGMYQFLGEQVALAVRNESPGDRARALKALSYTIGMHVLVAGAMGLPTEPIKLVVTAANGLGVIDWNWQDVENAQRQAAADIFGSRFGEIVSRGVPRALGVDLSSRMGMDTMMGPLGEPRSNEAQDWKAYMWDSLSGAPAGLIADWAKGINDLAEGDVVRAAERLVPIKVFSDSIKAYRTMTEGTVSERTGKQMMSPYSASEAVIRGLGFGPAREAESFERSAAFHRNKDWMDAKTTEFKRAWVEATGAARGRLWRDIQKFNRGLPAEARIKISDLRDYQRKMKRDRKETVEGIKADKRDRRMLESIDDVYNFEP